VGRSIFPADSFSRTSKPAAGEREPADCRACQIKRKTRRRLETFTDGVSAGPKPALGSAKAAAIHVPQPSR
jgi:hypothetical protein